MSDFGLKIYLATALIVAVMFSVTWKGCFDSRWENLTPHMGDYMMFTIVPALIWPLSVPSALALLSEHDGELCVM